VPVVNKLDGGLKQGLEVLDVDNLLFRELINKPSFKGSVISFDLSLGLRITRFYPVAMHTQHSQTGAEDLRVVSRRTIELYAHAHTPLGYGWQIVLWQMIPKKTAVIVRKNDYNLNNSIKY